MINRTLDNRYTIMEYVGGGGMAEVYRAYDKLLDRSVAVKILRPQFTDDEEFVVRFRREAQAAAKLSHPNIVNIYDVGRTGDVYYIVMEYISGETLKDRIKREGALPPERALKIALDIAEALEHAHQNNLVHCDIKPHNILVTAAGRVKVTDFGIARAVTSATLSHSGTVMGSVHYLSPEQAKGGLISAKSDLYSLGVLLFEMLTGKLPFTGDNQVGIALKHVQEEPPHLRTMNENITPLAEAVVLKAMAKEPADRYANAAAMAADLRLARSCLQDDGARRLAREDFPTQALPPLSDAPPVRQTAPSEARGVLKSRKWLVGLLLVLICGFLLGAFLSYGKFWSNAEITVPDVVGKQAGEARKILEDAKLRVSVSETYNDTIAAGLVASQLPEANAVVKESRTITIYVSKGGESAVVPDIRGLDRRDAELTLKNAGLAVGLVEEQFSDRPAGTVLNQNPRPPAQVMKNTSIDLVVSKGAGPRKVVLPDFSGAPLSTVNTQLESLKLKLGAVTQVVNDQYPAGTIVGQNPAPSSEVLEGTNIDFKVAKAAVNPVRRANVSFTVPDGPAKQRVQMILTDADGRRTIYDKTRKPGDRVEKTIEGSGTIRIQIYINKVLFQEQNI